MKVDIYESNTKRGLHVLVAAGQDPSTVLPQPLDAAFQSLSTTKLGVVLAPGIIGVDPVRAEADINSQGYALTQVSVTTTTTIQP